MIPVGLPSLDFVLIRLGLLLATLVWLCWSLRLALSAGARARLRSGRAFLFGLLTGLACWTIWTVYVLNREMAAYEAAQKADYRPVLATEERLGGIDMPAGTTLKLSLARQPEAFRRAEFPHPVLIGGVEALVAERYLSIQTGADFQTTGFTPQNLRLTGRGESLQQGWRCDATYPIVFATASDGAITSFESCVAADGNQIEGRPLLAGAEIIATDGRLYPDGRRGTDRWLIHLPKKAGAILLDGPRRIIERVPG